MWLSIKERRHCLLDFPEKCSDDKFVHANAPQVGILWRKGILYRERDNGLDNKTVPSRFGPPHPFSFPKILKSRNRNFNPVDPNESVDVQRLDLDIGIQILAGVKLFTNVTKSDLETEPPSFEKINSAASSHVGVKLTGIDVRARTPSERTNLYWWVLYSGRS